MKAQQDQLVIYNSLKGEKEPFVPMVEGKVGMYVCGPTLYSEPHMGNMRTFINFDLIYRYLLHLGFSVKYVRTSPMRATSPTQLVKKSIALALLPKRSSYSL